MSLWAWWIAATVLGIGIYELAQWLRQRDRERAALWVREFQATFPGRCPVCSFTRWGREIGVSAAWSPAPPHPCTEAPPDPSDA